MHFIYNERVIGIKLFFNDLNKSGLMIILFILFNLKM